MIFSGFFQSVCRPNYCMAKPKKIWPFCFYVISFQSLEKKYGRLWQLRKMTLNRMNYD